MAVQRVQYEDRYAIDFQTTAIATVQAMTDGIDTASGFEKSGILLNNHPDIVPGQAIIDKKKATGSASRVSGPGREFQQGIKEPSFSIEFDVSSKVLYGPLRLFTQRGALSEDSTAGSDTTDWFVPYSYEGQPALAEVWANFVRQLAPDGQADSHRALGAIVNSITLSSEVGQAFVCSADFMVYDAENNYAVSAANDNFEFTNDATLLWQNATTSVSDGFLAHEAVDLDGFSLTLSAEVSRKFYSNQLTSKYLFKEITGEGSIKIPWANSTTNFLDNVFLRNFIAGTPTRFSIYWTGQYPSANNHVSINFIARYTGAPVGQDEDEIVTDLSFIVTERILFDTLVDGNDNITSFVETTGTVATMVFEPVEGTFDGNLFPGDMVRFPDSTTPNTKVRIDEVEGSTDFHLETSVTTPGLAEMVIYSQPFNIGVNDGIVRGDALP